MHRRTFLQSFALGGAAALTIDALTLGKALAAMPPAAFVPTTSNRKMHLARRITYGITPDMYARLQTLSEAQFIEEQLNPETLADPIGETVAGMFDLYGMTSRDILAGYAEKRGEVVQQLVGRALAGAMVSERSLYELMVAFWSDHFNIFIGKGLSVFLKIADDRDVIRPHALGTFRELLFASAQSPAMLFYLDNAQSSAAAPNENYARELLELHTLGVDGGYSEADVKAAAKLLTGWSIGRREDGEQLGEFVFRPRQHDDSPQTILGVTIDALGQAGGEALLELLATHPATARHISTKLVRRFVADEPPPALVERVAQTYLATDGDIRAMLRLIFTSEEFWLATPKFKRPFEYYNSVLRALAFGVRDMDGFGRATGKLLEALGQVPFTWPAPNGFPDVGRYWMSNLLPRWNMAIAAANERDLGSPDFERLAAQAIASGQSVQGFLGDYLLGRPLTEAETSVANDFAQHLTADPEQQNLATLILLLVSPAYQYR